MTAPRKLNLYFNHDNGFGSEIPVKATVEIDALENAKVIEIEAWGERGGELSYGRMQSIEELAIEKAYEHLVDQDLRQFPTKLEVVNGGKA